MALYNSDGRRKLVLLATTPTDIAAIPVATATGGTDISDWTLKSSQVNVPSGSDTFDASVWSSRGNATAYGASNLDGNFVIIHREYDPATMQPDATDDATWASLKVKGTTVRFLTRKSAKLSGAAFTAGDEYRYAEYVTDDPIDESPDDGSYQKFRIPLSPSGVMSLDQLIVI